MYIAREIGMALMVLVGWRMLDHLADRSHIARLRQVPLAPPTIFDPAMIGDLPKPARRFFSFASA
jgi:hypothetical protein